jgi:hypothetical protein
MVHPKYKLSNHSLRNISTRLPKQPTIPDEMNLPLINPNAAGIDLGADRHWVSVPMGRDSESVRSERLFYSRSICNG